MSLRPNLHPLLCGLTLAVALTAGLSAKAQLGSVNNPPPQHLFNFDDTPKRRDDGLGTMAERRRALARLHDRHPVHRRTVR